jgi:hypothetical protein
MLAVASTVTERAVVAHLRQLYLDDMARRDPAGLRAWLATGPPIHSDPGSFLRNNA